MLRAPSSLIAVFLALAPPASAAKVALIVADEIQARAAGARAGTRVSVLTFDLARLADPIEKGRFVALLQSSDRVIAAADGAACGWLGLEVEGVPVDCVTPYDAGQVLDFARSAGWGRIAAVHITGYEKVFRRLRGLARARGIELVAFPVEKTRDLPGILPGALASAHAVWILGDPRLTEGAAFEFIVGQTLARRIPVIAPSAELVARGAFLGAESDRAGLLLYAAGLARAAAGGTAPEDSAAEVPGGRLVVNQVLARRWGVRVPGGRP